MSVKSWIASLSDSSDYRSALRRVGVVAIFVGVIDTIAFVIAIITRHSYSSSLTIFAVIAGVALIRGNLNTCLKVARWIGFAGGSAIGLIGGLLSIGILGSTRLRTFIDALPSSLQHLTAVQLLAWLLYTGAYAGLMVWAFRSLTSTTVLNAMRSEGVDCDSFFDKPITSFYGGVAFGVVFVAFIYVANLHSGQPASYSSPLQRTRASDARPTTGREAVRV